MRRHFKYLKGLLKHKYWVFIYSLKLKVPFHLAIFHDISKFSPVEWFPYVNLFYNKDGSKRKIRDETGGYDVNKQNYNFRKAWLHHQKNKHHWQAWCSLGNNGNINALDMPEKYILEMIADWCSAGICYKGKAEPLKWYNTNKDKMIFSENTHKKIQEILDKNKFI
jgi:hypothetical protein